jgi:hypothetical protein
LCFPSTLDARGSPAFAEAATSIDAAGKSLPAGPAIVSDASAAGKPDDVSACATTAMPLTTAISEGFCKTPAR